MSNDPKFITTLTKYVYHGDNYTFYQKGSLLVGLNGAGTCQYVEHLAIHASAYLPFQPLTEILSCATIIVERGKLNLNMRRGGTSSIVSNSFTHGIWNLRIMTVRF